MTTQTLETSTLLKYLPHLANAGLVVLLGLAAGQLFWSAWPLPTSDTSPGVLSRDTSHGTDTLNMERIAAAHLFGRLDKTGAGAAAGANAPETKLDLTLTGVLANVHGKDSRALIRQEEEEAAYAVGDIIAGSAEVHAIEWNRVILERGGRFETLTLKLEEGGEARRVSASPEPDTAEQLGEFRDKVAAEPALLSKYLTVKPAEKNGELVGARIFPTGKSRAIFEEAGIEPGAVVTMVNGIRLDQRPLDLKYLATELQDARQFTLSLKHRGRNRTVSISLD